VTAPPACVGPQRRGHHPAVVALVLAKPREAPRATGACFIDQDEAGALRWPSVAEQGVASRNWRVPIVPPEATAAPGRVCHVRDRIALGGHPWPTQRVRAGKGLTAAFWVMVRLRCSGFVSAHPRHLGVNLPLFGSPL